MEVGGLEARKIWIWSTEPGSLLCLIMRRRRRTRRRWRTKRGRKTRMNKEGRCTPSSYLLVWWG